MDVDRMVLSLHSISLHGEKKKDFTHHSAAFPNTSLHALKVVSNTKINHNVTVSGNQCLIFHCKSSLEGMYITM